jgi:hypothetical protein
MSYAGAADGGVVQRAEEQGADPLRPGFPVHDITSLFESPIEYVRAAS